MKQETPKSQTQQQNINVPNQDPRRRKKTQQDFKRQADENKKRWMPFVKFMKKHGLKLKTARCQKFRVEYFRTKDLRKIVDDKKQQIDKNPTLQQLVGLWQRQVIYFNRPENIPKLKYPKVLERSQVGPESKFASFKFDPAEPKTWLFPALLIGVIAVVLFPLWPYMLKYVVFMISLVLVTTILSIIVLRLVAYLFGAMFGISFWILPNFFADCTIMESFVPIYESKKWQGGMFSAIGRVLAFSIFAYYGYQVYIDSSWVYENIDITKQSFDDLHDWGVSKIKGEKNFSQSALTNLDTIMNQTADVHVDETIELGNQQAEIKKTEKNEQQDIENNFESQDVNHQGQQKIDGSKQL